MATAVPIAKSPNPRQRETRLVLAVGIGVFLFSLFRQRHFFHDDTFIELRYALNVLHGDGLVWNPGERIEGFTSPLHLALVTLVAALTPLSLQHAAQLINCAAALLLLGSFHRALALVAPGERLETTRAIGWLTLLGALPLTVWIWGGLEAVLVAALIGCAQLPLLTALKEARPARSLLWSGALFGLAGLARPDAALFLIASVAVLLLLPVRPFLERLRGALIMLAPACVIGLLLIGLRDAYFGQFLPNTYVAKVFGIPLLLRLTLGLRYVAQSLLAVPLLTLLPICLAVHPRVFRHPVIMLLGVEAALFAIGIVWAGGDHMLLARFFVPLLPILALLLTAYLARRPPLLGKGIAAFAIVIIITGSLFTAPMRVDPAAWVGQLVGDYIAKSWPEGSLVALNTAGSTPFTAPRMRYIDMLGLNDARIARRNLSEAQISPDTPPGHLKGDGDYILSRKPDFIIAGHAEGQTIENARFLSEQEMARRPEFRDCYRLETVAISYDDAYARIGPARPNPLVFTYYRRICGR